MDDGNSVAHQTFLISQMCIRDRRRRAKVAPPNVQRTDTLQVGDSLQMGVSLQGGKAVSYTHLIIRIRRCFENRLAMQAEATLKRAIIASIVAFSKKTDAILHSAITVSYTHLIWYPRTTHLVLPISMHCAQSFSIMRMRQRCV